MWQPPVTLLLQTFGTVRVQLSTADLIKQAMCKNTLLQYLTVCLGACCVVWGGIGGEERHYILTNSNKSGI